MTKHHLPLPRRWLALLAVALLCGAGSFHLSRVSAAESTTPATPPAPVAAPAPFKLGFVNLREVFDKYEKTKKVNAEIEAANSKAKEEADKLVAKKKELAEQLKLMRAGSPEYQQMSDDLEMLDHQMENLQKHFQEDMMQRLLSNTEQIYLEIQDAIAEYGKQNQYTLILKVDSMDLESIHSNSLQALNEKIQSRPVLFYSAALDLTQAIIDKVNENQ